MMLNWADKVKPHTVWNIVKISIDQVSITLVHKRAKLLSEFIENHSINRHVFDASRRETEATDIIIIIIIVVIIHWNLGARRKKKIEKEPNHK